jgi:hypothetical protein
MSIALWIVTIYLLVGLLFLIIFDVATKRIRNRLDDATFEVKNKLAMSGSYVGTRIATTVLLFAIWLMWPVVIVGALTTGKEQDNGTQR